MPSFRIFDIAGSGMLAQSTRLNLVASNLSNAETVSSSIEQTYKSRQPVFATHLQSAKNDLNAGVGVRVAGIVESQAPLRMEYMPHHPKADENGYIFKPNVDTLEETTNMMSASRSYQDNAQIINTAKQLMQQTLKLGQG
ncbi:flagellar basal body rod protein FlgC [Candidatus Woesearchaeota archaeon]|jgi:flagellar basal-body rod protein FlgC|nr:flagellar basal body rod protein FlgC [Candidatus Woesearchaeota archaeon]